MKCLDSDFLINILRGSKEVEETMKKLEEEGKASTTSVNAFEVLFGAYKSGRKENIEESLKLLSRVEILNFDMKAADKAAEILSELTKKGDIIDFRDLFTASIAVTNGMQLVTENKKHFSKVKNLQLY